MNWQIRLSSAKNNKIYGLVDKIVSIFVDMECAYVVCCRLFLSRVLWCVLALQKA
jgi:hypothetical protein